MSSGGGYRIKEEQELDVMGMMRELMASQDKRAEEHRVSAEELRLKDKADMLDYGRDFLQPRR
jgi:hypothetical protein